MVIGTGFSTFIDIGFIALVTASCWLSLTNSGSSDERRSEKWLRELEALKASLGALIAEASAASQNLDNNLVQRKHELTALLEQIDRAQGGARARHDEPAWELGGQEAARPVQPQPYAQPQQYTPPVQPPAQSATPAPASNPENFDPDLPNSSWVTNEAPTSEPVPPSPLPRQTPPTPVQPTMPPHQAPPTQAPPAEPNPPRLNDQIELTQEMSRQVTLRRPSTVDPVAYRIARRLLEEGKEIHVVSRKLDLPLEEVRAIDRLVRPAEAAADPADTAGRDTAFNSLVNQLTATGAFADDESLESMPAAT